MVSFIFYGSLLHGLHRRIKLFDFVPPTVSEKVWDFTCDGNSRRRFVPYFLFVFSDFSQLSLISRVQMKSPKKSGEVQLLLFFFLIPSVNVGVCATQHSHDFFLFFLFLCGCLH